MRLSKLKKLDPSAIDKCAMVFVPPLACEKEEIEVFFDIIALKGSHSMGDGRIFLKSLREASSNKILLNEPTFGRIHLTGQYL
jgi:hypothetical protein